MDFIVFMEKEILNKKRQGKIKTAKNYQAARNTLVQFLAEKRSTTLLELETFDAHLVKAFENYLLSKKDLQEQHLLIICAYCERYITEPFRHPAFPPANLSERSIRE